MFLCLGPHPVVFRDYSRLCTQELLLVVLGVPGDLFRAGSHTRQTPYALCYRSGPKFIILITKHTHRFALSGGGATKQCSPDPGLLPAILSQPFQQLMQGCTGLGLSVPRIPWAPRITSSAPWRVSGVTLSGVQKPPGPQCGDAQGTMSHLNQRTSPGPADMQDMYLSPSAISPAPHDNLESHFQYGNNSNRCHCYFHLNKRPQGN